MMIVAAKHIQSNKKPAHNAVLMLVALYIFNVKKSFNDDPARPKDRFNPIANATSVPTKYTANKADSATHNDSPPKPYMVLPTNINGYDDIDAANANTACPQATKDKNNNNDTSAPIL
eukprot:328339_1